MDTWKRKLGFWRFEDMKVVWSLVHFCIFFFRCLLVGAFIIFHTCFFQPGKDVNPSFLKGSRSQRGKGDGWILTHFLVLLKFFFFFFNWALLKHLLGIIFSRLLKQIQDLLCTGESYLSYIDRRSGWDELLCCLVAGYLAR